MAETLTNDISTQAGDPSRYNNWVNDITAFGEKSYVVDPMFDDVWKELTTQSRLVFSVQSIHEVVYERLTSSDIDYIIYNNKQLGEAFNSFHRSTAYRPGDIDHVLMTITEDSFNALEPKFKWGVGRYIEAHMSGNGVAAWLDKVFENNIFVDAGKTTCESILQDQNMYVSVTEYNASMKFILSYVAIRYACMNGISDYVTELFINASASSVRTMTELISALETNEKLEYFFSNAAFCKIVMDKEPAMKAICYNLNAFATVIASETAMNAVANSSAAINVINAEIENIAKTQAVLDQIKAELGVIEELLPEIEDTAENVRQVQSTRTTITNCNVDIDSVIKKSDILIKNIDELINSEDFIALIVESPSAMDAIGNSDKAIERFMSNDTTRTAILKSKLFGSVITNHKGWMTKIANSRILLKQVFDTPEAAAAVEESKTAISYLKSSSLLETVQSAGGSGKAMPGFTMIQQQSGTGMQQPTSCVYVKRCFILSATTVNLTSLRLVTEYLGLENASAYEKAKGFSLKPEECGEINKFIAGAIMPNSSASYVSKVSYISLEDYSNMEK